MWRMAYSMVLGASSSRCGSHEPHGVNRLDTGFQRRGEGGWQKIRQCHHHGNRIKSMPDRHEQRHLCLLGAQAAAVAPHDGRWRLHLFTVEYCTHQLILLVWQYKDVCGSTVVRGFTTVVGTSLTV